MINHLLDEIRKEIRKKLDVDDELFASAKSALEEITQMLGRLAISKTGADEIDVLDEDTTIDDLARQASESQLLLPIHRESLQL